VTSALRTPPNPEDVRRFCDTMTEWAELMTGHGDGISATFDTAWTVVLSSIYKSCLLDRMMYGGEKPSRTPCPVHKGVWSGIHFGALGCSCDQHRCGCTTGWLPDEHCGCGGKEQRDLERAEYQRRKAAAG
jgi:hypothetical protein